MYDFRGLEERGVAIFRFEKLVDCILLAGLIPMFTLFSSEVFKEFKSVNAFLSDRVL